MPWDIASCRAWPSAFRASPRQCRCARGLFWPSPSADFTVCSWKSTTAAVRRAKPRPRRCPKLTSASKLANLLAQTGDVGGAVEALIHKAQHTRLVDEIRRRHLWRIIKFRHLSLRIQQHFEGQPEALDHLDGVRLLSIQI